jgi:hypothetical protein
MLDKFSTPGFQSAPQHGRVAVTELSPPVQSAAPSPRQRSAPNSPRGRRCSNTAGAAALLQPLPRHRPNHAPAAPAAGQLTMLLGITLPAMPPARPADPGTPPSCVGGGFGHIMSRSTTRL